METESNCLEKHFQIYLERRKMENNCRQESTQQLIAQSKNQTSEILRKIGRSQSLIDHKDSIIRKSKSCILEEDLDLDEEFLQLKEKLTKTQSNVETTVAKSAGSSPTNELKNAIWEAKNKFFENEQLFRERKEKELMAEHRITHKLSDHSSLYHDSNTSKHKEKEQIIVFNINTKTESKDSKETQANMDEDDSSGKCISSGGLAKKSPRRELFPKEANIDIRFEEIDEPLCGTNRNLRQTLNDLKLYTQNIERKEEKSTESSEDLIKQSMAKMKQLFEEKPIESTKFVPMAKIQDSNDETYSSSLKGGNNNGARETNKPPIKERQLDLKQVQDTNLTTSSTAATTPNTTTLTTTSTTSATSASVVDTIAKRQLNMLESLTNIPGTSMVNIQGDINKIQAPSHINHISQTLKPPMFNLTSDDSEEVSTVSEPNENQNSGADISEISSDEEVPIADTNDDIPASLVITPKRDSLEIGEILSENQATFFPIPKLNISGSSTSSDSELEISAGKGSRKCTSKTSADSESEFWA